MPDPKRSTCPPAVRRACPPTRPPKLQRRGKPRRRRVGFVGCPPEELLAPRRSQDLIDLDNLIEGVAPRSETLLPRTTCHIIRRILDNALALPLDEIIIDEGLGKCDAARGLAELLRGLLDIPILRTQNQNQQPAGAPISDSALPLRRKIELILESLVHPSVVPARLPPEPHPRAAIWGVPAADLSLYELFPDGSQVLGWSRCLENRTPADWELEMHVPEQAPTVFFAQAFCPKNVVARHLARKHNGLHVDADGVLSQPVKAKIEAFLRFRKVWR